MTHTIHIVLAVLAVCYTGVLAAVVADLCSGLRRARRDGHTLTSRGLRRTVTKLTSYYSALFALTAVDAMLISSALGLKACGIDSIPAFPYITALGALGLSLIEVKSILENTGLKLDLEGVAGLIGRILSSWKVIKF
ncbi:MAG: phage holin family protein [Muribaculaceae bacterium]|nr:phage holin family protein [Muribaculaceae bacterium]